MVRFEKKQIFNLSIYCFIWREIMFQKHKNCVQQSSIFQITFRPATLGKIVIISQFWIYVAHAQFDYIVLNGWVSISNYVKVQTPKYLTFSLVVVKPLLPLDRPWSIKVIQVEHPYPSRRFPPFKRCIARQAWTISQWAGNKRLHYLRKKRLIAWFPVLEKRHDSHPGIHYCPALLLHGSLDTFFQ